MWPAASVWEMALRSLRRECAFLAQCVADETEARQVIQRQSHTRRHGMTGQAVIMPLGDVKGVHKIPSQRDRRPRVALPCPAAW